MTRKMLTATMIVTAMFLSILALGGLTNSADAQGHPTCPYNAAIMDDYCADAQTYPGPFTNHPPAPSGPYGWGDLDPLNSTDANVAGAIVGVDSGLAHTGSESAVLGYVGTGLIAFGAVALGSRRKFFQGALED